MVKLLPHHHCMGANLIAPWYHWRHFSKCYKSGQITGTVLNCSSSLPVAWLIMVLIPLTYTDFPPPVGTHTNVSHCQGIQPLVPPLGMPPFGNSLMLQYLKFCASLFVFPHALPVPGAAMTKTIPRNRHNQIRTKANQIAVKKMHGSGPHSHLIGQFVKQHLVMIWKE